jgi:hypothetical protein
MSLNKKLLASAIAGLLFSANAGAVILGTDDARVYASELKAPVDLSADAADTAEFEIGYNFSDGEVRYGRFECSSNLTMDNVVVSTASADITLGAINGEGTSALFFSMTAGAVPGVTADDVIEVDGDNTLDDGGNVSCAFSIYDQPSQAQAGGATGRIYTTGMEPFIARASGFVFEMDPTGADQSIADVEAPDGAYFEFLGTAHFGNLTFDVVPDVLNDAGAQIALTDIFGADTEFTLDGDFSAANDPTCPVEHHSWGCPDSVDGTEATYVIGGNALNDSFHYYESDEAAIKASEYTATLHADANPGYTVADVGPIHVGSIIRNGTQLQAPLVQLPTDWVSRIALTNTGTIARPYEISLIGETGVTFTTDAAKLTGTIPAKGTKVVDLNEVITGFSAGSRGTINVNVSAPNTQIQGLYQIVNPTSGSISNHVMVRQGSN